MPFGVSNGAPNLTVAIEAAGGVVNTNTVIEAVCTLNTEDYPVIKFMLSGGGNSTYISTMYNYIVGNDTATWSRIAFGDSTGEVDCTPLASFTSFDVKYTKTAGVVNVYGSFVLSANVNLDDPLFSIGSSVGTPNLEIGDIVFVTDTKYMSVKLLENESTIKRAGSIGDIIGSTCYVNLTFKA